MRRPIVGSDTEKFYRVNAVSAEGSRRRTSWSQKGRQAVRAGLNRLGLDIRFRKSAEVFTVELRSGSRVQAAAEPPPLFDDPLEAIYWERGGKPAAFRCPIDRCVHTNGLSFSSKGWHPCSALLDEVISGGAKTYEGSILHRYYQLWQPANAQEALIGLEGAAPRLGALPSHLMYLFPWMSRTPEEADTAVRAWAHGDNIEHGHPEITIDTDGFKDHGPVSPEIGRLEFQRLRQTHATLSRVGYDRTKGDVSVLVIRRGDDFRFLSFGGGLHRTAAMRALGHDFIPAKPQRPWVIDVDEVGRWPQVRSGVWTRDAAIRYIDHLFDFDAVRWATTRGLLVSADAKSSHEP